jgi:hypothetical protein
MNDRPNSKSVPSRWSWLVIVVAVIVFGAGSALYAWLEWRRLPQSDSAAEAWSGVSSLHPHHPAGVCRDLYYPSGQPGTVVDRAFDGRIPRWKKPAGPVYERSYDFDPVLDTFSHNIPVWKELLAPYVGKPDVSYLEIGVWEGRSALWMLENVLTSPSARLTLIDILVTPRWAANLDRSGRRDSVRMLVGESSKILLGLNPESFDIIYIDGSHWADDVLSDAVLSFALLKPGGILIFDDYCYDASTYGPDRDALPLEQVPKAAIDAFLLAYGPRLEVLHRYYQVAVRKRIPVACQKPHGNCMPFQVGNWVFGWTESTLHNTATGATTTLTAREHQLLQKIARTSDIGRPGYHLTTELAAHAALGGLEAKLGVKFER